ncbi:MAG: ArsR/SmtB family transcription factor [Spirochaetota bacterium]
MEESQFKSIVFREIGTVMAALAEPRRLALLDLLAQCERNVESLASMLDVGVTTVSHHLQVLKRARLVHERSEGRYRYYSASATALELWEAISRVASEHLSEIKCAVGEVFAAGGEPVSYAEAARRARAGEAVLVDVRPSDEYRAGHAPEAISLPLEELESGNAASVARFREGVEVFAYCRGRYCLLSQEAVEYLKQRGVTARRIEDGVAEWKATGRMQ